MLTFKEYLREQLSKNRWEFLSLHQKEESADELISLVDNAYKHTTLGSFVKSINDVKSSGWIALDYDENPDIDIAIFYRTARPSEMWDGKKIQGVGHNGSPEAKDKLMKKLVEVLHTDGWWIEASEAMEKSLRKRGAPVVTNPKIINKLFSNVKSIAKDGVYTRELSSSLIKETSFGRPKIK